MIPLLEPMLSDFKPGTLAWLIQRVIEDIRSQPDMRQLGPSHIYVIRAVGRTPLGQKIAHKLTRGDFVDYGKLRRSQFVRNTTRKVTGPTVIQELSYVRGVLKHALSEWDDCENLAPVLPALEAALLVLSKRGLVNKSIPRTQVPEGDQLEQLKAAARERAKEPRCVIKRLDDVIEFAAWSTRRLGEICRITRGDADFERGMYMVRDVKHPRYKKGNDKWFPMLGPIKEILQRQPRIGDDPNERFFPYNAKSVSQAYAALKRELGIKNLRFHDNRRLAITQWLAVFGNPHKVKLISGHETTQILERVYDATKGDVLLTEYADLMRRPSEELTSAFGANPALLALIRGEKPAESAR